MGITLTPEERFEVFGQKDPERYGEETTRRWGGTHTYERTQARVATYTKDDWKLMKEEIDAWGSAYGALMDAGEAPGSAAAVELAEAHRAHITRWFFDCHPRVHQGLAEMYVSDEHYRAFYESIHEGLAEHLRAAIHANARRLGDLTG